MKAGTTTIWGCWKKKTAIVKIALGAFHESALMIKSILGTFSTKLLTALLSFALIILLSQHLGAEGKGEASLILTTITIIILFCDFVGGSSLVYLAPRHNLPSLLAVSYIWTFFISALAYLGLHLYPVLPEPYIIHTVLIAFLQALFCINLFILLSNEKIRLFNLGKLIQIGICVIVAGSLLYTLDEKSVYAYIIGLYISSIITFLLSLYWLPKQKNRPDLKAIGVPIRAAFQLGSLNQFANIAQFLNYRASYYILGIYWTSAEIGIYSNSASIAESVWIFTNSVNLVQYASIANSDNNLDNKNLTIGLCKVSFLFTTIPVLILCLLPPGLYKLVFGAEFGDMTYAIRALAPGILLYNFSKVLSHYFSGTGRYQYNMLGAFSGLLVTIIIGLWLIPSSPLTGSGLTTSLSYLCSSLVLLGIFLRIEKESFSRFIPDSQDWSLLRKELSPGRFFKK